MIFWTLSLSMSTANLHVVVVSFFWSKKCVNFSTINTSQIGPSNIFLSSIFFLSKSKYGHLVLTKSGYSLLVLIP